jgi:hypothetical protein
VRRALYCSKIISYAQGYMLLKAAAKENGWNLNMGGIALMWRGGCIIRSRFLGKIKEAFDKNHELTNLLLDSFFFNVLNQYQPSWRKALVQAIELGIPTPAFSTALAFFDGYRADGCPPICCRPSATISARTPTSASTSRAASSSTQIGQAQAAESPPPPTMPSCGLQADHNSREIECQPCQKSRRIDPSRKRLASPSLTK